MSVEERMEEHLDGFPARQKEMIERFDALDRKMELVRTHTEPSPKTLLKIEEVRQENSEAYKNLEKKFDDLFAIVNEKLLPVYEKEMSKEQAKKILREEFEGFSFWGKTWLIWVAVLASIGAAVKIWIMSGSK